MGIGNFFGKVWGGVKKVGRAIGSGVRKVGRAVKPALDVAHKVAGLAEHIPGFIGDIAGSLRGGLETANEWIDMIPESGVKDKLKEYSGEASNLIDKGEEWANEKGEVITGYVDKTKPYLDAADKISDKMSGADKAKLQKQQAMRKEVEIRDKYARQAKGFEGGV